MPKDKEYNCKGCGLVWRASEYLYADDSHTISSWDRDKYTEMEQKFIEGTECPNCDGATITSQDIGV